MVQLFNASRSIMVNKFNFAISFENVSRIATIA